MALTGIYEPSRSEWVRDQVALFESSGGRQGNTEVLGKTIVVVTSVGAKTGRLRKNPVVRVEHEGRYALVASAAGASSHPAWYHNLLAHPHVELQDGPVKREMAARLLTGEEREEWWARAVELFPNYGKYATATTRVIPVFLLEEPAA